VCRRGLAVCAGRVRAGSGPPIAASRSLSRCVLAHIQPPEVSLSPVYVHHHNYVHHKFIHTEVECVCSLRTATHEPHLHQLMIVQYDSSRETLARKELLSTLRESAASERRVALKPCVSLWALPRHLTADTVSCKQLLTVTTRATCVSKVESSYFRAHLEGIST